MASKIQLRIRCAEIKKLDLMSKSDPYVKVLLRQHSPTFVEIGRTELIKNSDHPEFKTIITLDYAFNELQELKFVVNDSDDHGKDADLIGEAEVSVGRMLSEPGHRFVGDLRAPVHEKRRGVIFVTATAFAAEYVMTFDIALRGEHLDKKDVLGKSDPYFKIFRKEEGVVDSHAWTQVAESEVIQSTLDPKWKPLTIADTALCGANPGLPLRIEVYDWDRNSAHDLIGVATTSLGELIQLAAHHGSLELINQKKAEKGGGLLSGKYKNSGLLFVDACTPRPRPHSFMEYLGGGLELGVVIAVDFTGSNGLPKEKSSLHYLNPDPTKPNAYQSVIASVGSILSCYDADQQFPAFGFGGSMPNGVVSHCFPLDGDAPSPACPGVGGILAAYGKAIHRYPLSGPTCLGPIVRSAYQYATSRPGPRLQYTVLLVITDGEINDMPETVDAIVAASGGPMSIIIVGVGKADFSSMNRLDADAQPLRSRHGDQSKRDIVQFVAFRDFNPADPAALAAAVLAEIPAQVAHFFNDIARVAPFVLPVAAAAAAPAAH